MVATTALRLPPWRSAGALRAIGDRLRGNPRRPAIARTQGPLDASEGSHAYGHGKREAGDVGDENLARSRAAEPLRRRDPGRRGRRDSSATSVRTNFVFAPRKVAVGGVLAIG